MLDFIGYIVVAFVTSAAIYFFKEKSTKRKKEIRTLGNNIFVRNKENFAIDLDNIIVEGFSYSEGVGVDVYDEELEEKKLANRYTLSNTFHKYKDTTRFNSLIIIPFNYNGRSYNLKTKIPKEDISIRMKLYQQKTTQIYISSLKVNDLPREHAPRISGNNNKLDNDYFFIDFRFLDIESIYLVNLGPK